MIESPLRGLSVLVVDDDVAHREALAESLASAGAEVVQAGDGREGLSRIGLLAPDVVVVDLRMPGIDGLEMAARLREKRVPVPIVLTTAYGDAASLARAIELGVDGFVAKPVDVEALVRTVRRCGLTVLQRREIDELHRSAAASLEARLGPSAAMKEVRASVAVVAATGFSVLLQGETGVGKTHLARAIHELSDRSGRPFIHVDLGSIPETLVEGEIFGVRRGAFTGADRDRPGRIAAAGNGTLFLDEVSGVPLSVQGKLLQAVEEKEYTPLGSLAPIGFEARIISAVQGDARTAVREKRLREDLFFRLAEVELLLPPLRDRPEDVLFLSRRFAAEAADELKRPFSDFSSGAEGLLLGRPWPGNVRQLRNEVRRAVLLSAGDVLSEEDLRMAAHRAGEVDGPSPDSSAPGGLLRLPLAALEKLAFAQALRDTGQNWTKAAAQLGIDYSTFRRRLKRHGLDEAGPGEP